MNYFLYNESSTQLCYFDETEIKKSKYIPYPIELAEFLFVSIFSL